MVEETKTTIIVKEKTAAAIGTAAIAKERIAAAVEITAIMGTVAAIKTMTAVAKAPKIFKKKVIIAVEEKTAIVVAKTSKRGSIASFNREEKYI